MTAAASPSSEPFAASSLAPPQTPPAAGGATPPPTDPPRTLEEAVENVRTLLLQVRAMLHCLSEVLLYADDDDSVLHAEVAQAAAGWINDAAMELDLAKLKPLIDAIRRRGAKAHSEDYDLDITPRGPHQVKEPTAVYRV